MCLLLALSLLLLLPDSEYSAPPPPTAKVSLSAARWICEQSGSRDCCSCFFLSSGSVRTDCGTRHPVVAE